MHMLRDLDLDKKKPEIYWSMLQTAEQVAKRYNIGRDAMDEYGAASQQKACAAQAAGKFNDEIAPITVTAGVADKVMGLITKKVTVSADEGLREGTTKEGISGIKPALPGGVIAAGNASQFSDGAGACVVVSEEYAGKNNLKPLGRFLGFAVGGCLAWLLGIVVSWALGGVGFGAATFTTSVIQLRVAAGDLGAALALSLAVGVLGGFAPAQHAARLRPVEALRKA